MFPAKFVVCERSGDWAVAWRRALAQAAVRVHETRSLGECRSELAAAPVSVLAVAEEMAAAEPLAAWLATAHADFPRARLLLLAAPASRDVAWLAREAGVVQVVRSRMELPTALPWIVAHLARFTPPPAGVRERAWAKLPWPRQAHGKRGGAARVDEK